MYVNKSTVIGQSCHRLQNLFVMYYCWDGIKVKCFTPRCFPVRNGLDSTRIYAGPLRGARLSRLHKVPQSNIFEENIK